MLHEFRSVEDTKMAVYALAVILMLFAVSEGQYDAYSYSKENYPNPMKEPAICGRNQVRKSYVCDPDHILGSQDTEGMCVCMWLEFYLAPFGDFSEGFFSELSCPDSIRALTIIDGIVLWTK